MPALPPWLSLGPVSLERPASAGRVVVGVLDPTAVARVDPAGLVDRGPGSWSLDWWIGAEDRWHLPSREPAVRQRRIGPGPVIETAVRIPSGDAVHRTWASRVGEAEVLVVEVENASPTPVALALALRPYDVDGTPAGGLTRVDVRDATVWVAGRPGLWLPRPPNEAAGAAGSDLVERVQAGRALSWSGPVASPDGRVTAVVIYPLPHRARLRLVVPLDSSSSMAPVAPADVADHETVARGWGAVLDGAGRTTFPDPAATELAGRSRTRVLLSAPELGADLAAGVAGSGLRLAALAAGGHEAEALRAVDTMAAALWQPEAEVRPTVEAVGAMALAAGLADDRRVEPALTESLAGLTAMLDKRRTRKAARPAVAALAAHSARVDQAAAARTLARRAGPFGIDPWAWAGTGTGTDGAPGDDPASSGPVDGFDGDEAVEAAIRWLDLRRQLVVEHPGGGLDLLPRFPSAWRGGAAEVHRLPTLHGRISFAIRWHGYRPALLWELERRPGDPVVPLRCPGLDPDWSTTEATGEALLAGSPEGLAAPPAEGESFT